MATNASPSWRKLVGEAGERAVARELQERGWSVTDLNTGRREPNVDLVAEKGSRTVYIQVKTYNDYGWISGGGVNPDICAGGPLFNRSTSGRYRCDIVICVTPSSPGDRRVIRDDWRFFVMPVGDAEQLFRINIDAYFNTPKANGMPKVKRGACQDFVGPGKMPISYVLDHKDDYWPFENNFALLETGALDRT